MGDFYMELCKIGIYCMYNVPFLYKCKTVAKCKCVCVYIKL